MKVKRFLFVCHPLYGDPRYPLAHSIREPMPDYDRIAKVDPKTAPINQRELQGYFDDRLNIKYKEELRPDFPICPYDTTRPVRYLTYAPKTGNVVWIGESSKRAAEVFGAERLDVDNKRPRNSIFPGKPGDFETGVGPSFDGPYSRRGDEGNVMGIKNGNTSANVNYFSFLRPEDAGGDEPFVSSATFSPNRMISSSGVFGALSSGVADMTPWNTLLFRPDLYPNGQTGKRHDKPFHYGAQAPYDHLFMDFFWMPVVEPYSISEPFATSGKINMN